MPKKYLKKIPYSVPEPEYSRRKAEEQVLPFIRKTERDCWEYQGFRGPKGYGQIGMKDNTNEHTHRVVYRGLRGPIPVGWDVCHTCDNPPCVNPLHLFAAPRVANNIDARNKGRNWQTKKTHCPKGHSYAEYGVPHDTSPTWRKCSLCEKERQQSPKYLAWHREYQRKRRERKRAATNGSVQTQEAKP